MRHWLFSSKWNRPNLGVQPGNRLASCVVIGCQACSGQLRRFVATRMIITRHLLLTIGLLLFLFGGCSQPPSPQPQTSAQSQTSKPLTAPPEVTSESEEGIHDLLF